MPYKMLPGAFGPLAMHLGYLLHATGQRMEVFLKNIRRSESRTNYSFKIPSSIKRCNEFSQPAPCPCQHILSTLFRQSYCSIKSKTYPNFTPHSAHFGHPYSTKVLKTFDKKHVQTRPDIPHILDSLIQQSY